ncbi:MAG: DUF3999 domain-containing protein [Gammaproteobacteria bacterium]|nr:DUF3999 domain-containing protein [Gammaproteobacteria bacterium]MDH5802192.1 DUF3999 domain-containing protein [Gammaproteobacteria bacterium]
MNTLRLLFLTAASIPFMGNSYAEELSKNDFAYGIQVPLNARQVYEFTVNNAIYSHIQNRDLKDLRVFDPIGGMVPLSIKHNPTPVVAQAYETSHVLHFFPVFESADGPADNLNLYFKRDNTGTIVSINNIESKNKLPAPYYIVDQSKLGRSGGILSHSLMLNWNTDEVPKTVVTVETSKNLTNWRTVGSAALFHLEHNQQTLQQKIVDVSGLQRYIKIHFDQDKVRLLQLNKNAKKSVKTADTVQSQTLRLIQSGDNNYIYQLGGYFPTQSLKLLPGDSNAIYKISVYSGSDPNTINHLHHRGTIYRLAVADKTVTSPDIPLNSTAPYWKINIEERNQTVNQAPTLEITYKPHVVRLLSSETGVYTIAFGRAGSIVSPPRIPEQIENGHDLTVTPLTLNAPEALGGDGKLETPPPPKSYKKVILWGILVVVLLVMGFMVTRLMKQMNSSSD